MEDVIEFLEIAEWVSCLGHERVAEIKVEIVKRLNTVEAVLKHHENASDNEKIDTLIKTFKFRREEAERALRRNAAWKKFKGENRRLKTNKVKCKICGDVVESKRVHDFVECQCGGVAVDGGLEYSRVLGNREDFEDLCEFET